MGVFPYFLSASVNSFNIVVWILFLWTTLSPITLLLSFIAVQSLKHRDKILLQDSQVISLVYSGKLRLKLSSERWWGFGYGVQSSGFLGRALRQPLWTAVRWLTPIKNPEIQRNIPQPASSRPCSLWLSAPVAQTIFQ